MPAANPLHYLEIVTTEVDAVCAVHEATGSGSFGPPVAELGGARVCQMADGTRLGVRAPLHAQELPLQRAYRLVADLAAAVSACADQGAVIALPALEIPGQGRIAICQLGGIELGFWELP
ncbi:MAG: hydroxylase [Xanthomonadales bacterium]|nr:hydroxylase [Xanthomonadales bacterium]MCB1626234.1 hydroxylase [Xanthomonadales bacterium]